MINKKSKIFIAGHKGMVGSAIVRKLKKKGFSRIIFAEKKKLNLLDQDKVFKFLKKKTRLSDSCSCQGWRNTSKL